MVKKITGLIKLALPAGKATPAPPVGPALGQHGVNIAAFCDTLLRSEGSKTRLGSRLDSSMLGATMTAGTGTSTLPELEGMFARLQKFMQPPADVDLTGTEPPVDSTAALWLRFKQFDPTICARKKVRREKRKSFFEPSFQFS